MDISEVFTKFFYREKKVLKELFDVAIIISIAIATIASPYFLIVTLGLIIFRFTSSYFKGGENLDDLDPNSSEELNSIEKGVLQEVMLFYLLSIAYSNRLSKFKTILLGIGFVFFLCDFIYYVFLF